MIHIGIPQTIYISLSCIALLVAANRHGKPRSPENFWYTVLGILIAYPLLWWGGFFR
jgi:hypothetical protein